MRIKKLNSRGFSHDVLAVAFVVIFAVAGVAYLVASHADSCLIVYGSVSSAQSKSKNPNCNAVSVSRPRPPYSRALYQLYNQSISEHFYTSSVGQKNSKIHAGFTDQGVVGFLSPRGGTNLKPLYQLYVKKQPTAPQYSSNHHLYTSDKAERNALVKKGYVNQGIVGYVSKVQASKLFPLYRAYAPASGDYLYSADLNEFDRVAKAGGYQSQGIVGYIGSK